MALVKQLLTPADFSGIHLRGAVRPGPLPSVEPGASVGPGVDSSPYTGLSLPLTSAYQYNLNYSNVVQCGRGKSSLWLNGWSFHIPKDTPSCSTAGKYLGIGGGVSGLPTIWDSTSHKLQVNFEEVVESSYHLSSCMSQHYLSMFLYCPASAGNPARSLNFTVTTWASRDHGHFIEGCHVDSNTEGSVGVYASTTMRPSSKYINVWSGNFKTGETSLGTSRLIGFTMTHANMTKVLADYCTKAGVSPSYYGNPANWRFDGAGLQVETMWPNADRPAAGGPMPGQVGIRHSNVQINVFN